ncbi:hypothetical protein Tco_0697275 [Tanacetum coccineum]
MSSTTSAVTYTSVYIDSEPGRAFWGADDVEVSEGGIPRVIVLGYDGLPIRPVAPSSPDYIPGSEDPQTPPVPQDEDEYEFPAEEPLPPVDSPTVESPGHVTETDPEEDPEEYEDDETEDGPVYYPMDGGDDGNDDDGDSSRDGADGKDEDEEDEDEEEEEEHLAPADSTTVIPVDEPVFLKFIKCSSMIFLSTLITKKNTPIYEGYRNTIDLPDGNNVVPLRSDTIRLVQNGCSFCGLRFEDPNQHLKDFLKLVNSLDLDVAIKPAIGLNVFQQDPSPLVRILLPDSLLNSFHREGLPNSEMISLCSNNIRVNPSLKHGLDSRTYSKNSLIIALIFGSKFKFSTIKSLFILKVKLTASPATSFAIRTPKNIGKSYKYLLFTTMRSGMIQETSPNLSRQFPFQKTHQERLADDFLSSKIKLATC